ncbi:hypothetical protein ACFWIX_06130 [Pseudarthrobacter sp. NPDC058362]|uniref:hypothetical protein n=1 Tax=Pseudarthrobacter sp. NPDC058362 TaxID=3346458 RepID=UPI00364F2BD9
METLKKIVTNQYFPAAAVLGAVLIYWTVGLLGGLSLLHNNQPPLTTLTWLLFVYASAALTPLAGALALVDLVRRWRRNRAGAQEQAWPAEVAAEGPVAAEAPAVEAPRPEPRIRSPHIPEPVPKTPGGKKAVTKKTATKKSSTRKAA